MDRLRALLVSALLALPLAVAADAPPSGAQQQPVFKGGVFDPPHPAPELELPGSNGQTIKLSQFRGKVVAVAFGFSVCPRICPVTLANLSIVANKLGPAASDFQVLFITVDPERDTPERLREWLKAFNPTFLGATGTAEQLAAVRTSYGITAKKEASTIKAIGYEVHHSSSIFLVDPAGKLRVLVPFGKPADDILHDIKLLMKK